MRLLLALAPLLLAGCLQPGPGPGAVPAPPAPASVLPPSLLIDRGAQNGTLQFYVHAKQGNVRYDTVNLTEYNDYEPVIAWFSKTRTADHVYAFDQVVERAAASVNVSAAAGTQRYAWAAHVALNESASPPRLAVEPLDERFGNGTRPQAGNFTLPYETLMVPLEAR